MLHKGQNTERCLSKNLIWGVTSENAVSCAGRNSSHCCTLVGSFEKLPKCLCADWKPSAALPVWDHKPQEALSGACRTSLLSLAGRSQKQRLSFVQMQLCFFSPIQPTAGLQCRMFPLFPGVLLSKLHVQAGRFGWVWWETSNVFSSFWYTRFFLETTCY